MFGHISDTGGYVTDYMAVSSAGIVTTLSDFLTSGFDTVAYNLANTIGGAVTDLLVGVDGAISPIGIGLTSITDFLEEQLKIGTGMIDANLTDLSTVILENLGVTNESISIFFTDNFAAISGLFDTSRQLMLDGNQTLFDSLAGLSGDQLLAFGDALIAALSAIWEALADAAGVIATVIMSGMEVLAGTLHKFVLKPLLGLLDAASDALSPGSPDEEVKKAAEKWIKTLEEAIKRPIPKEGKSPPDILTLGVSAAAIIAGIIGVYSSTHAISAALDATHPVKGWGFKAAIMDILHTVSIDDALGPMLEAPIWAGVIVPMRMRWRQFYPYEVPGTGELVRMATQRIIPDDLYKESMSFHALDTTWSANLQRSNERVPSFGDMSRMKWLKKLTTDQLLDAQRHMGIQEEFIPGYEALLERLPGAGDLITMMVREVIDLTIFIETMTMQGVSEVWSMRHYEAHWILLPLGKVQEARYRGFIDDAELAKYLVLHDYKPEPRPGITLSDQELAGKLIWKIPGRIEARWMFKWGDIDQAGLEAFLISDGMDPDWAPIVARATARNQMLAEINRLRDNTKKSFVKGLITEQQLIANLNALRYSPDLIGFHIADAKADGERELKLEAIDLIVDGYVKDMITDDELGSGLKYYIVRPEVLEAELDRAYVRKFRKPKAS